MSLTLTAITKDEARRFVGDLHRHNLPPGKANTFQVGCCGPDGTLHGVAIVGRPVARALDDGATAEVWRVCTDGTPNACSILYGACQRAAKALGFQTALHLHVAVRTRRQPQGEWMANRRRTSRPARLGRLVCRQTADRRRPVRQFPRPERNTEISVDRKPSGLTTCSPKPPTQAKAAQAHDNRQLQ